MGAHQYIVRRMTRGEMDFAVDLAAKEGWNPGLHDADCFYRTDPNGFFIGLLGNQPIGCISAVSYGGIFGFIGFYIVLPECRGQGYGIQLWEAAMQYLRGHNIGLDGVVARQGNYMKSGFRLAYRNIRYESIVEPVNSDDPHVCNTADVSFDEICAYEGRLFPVGRRRFLECWIRMPESKALAVMENGAIAGYGVIRRCRRGYKIGPLFADTEDIANRLFQGLYTNIEKGEPVYLDVPEVNFAAVSLADRYNMRKVFETARMYTGEPPHISMDHIFGVTTFELG
jgi:ribosomal protein S18 acetylase RimI-like enzyme